MAQFALPIENNIQTKFVNDKEISVLTFKSNTNTQTLGVILDGLKSRFHPSSHSSRSLEIGTKHPEFNIHVSNLQ